MFVAVAEQPESTGFAIADMLRDRDPQAHRCQPPIALTQESITHPYEHL
jgi:hypothetical protein